MKVLQDKSYDALNIIFKSLSALLDVGLSCLGIPGICKEEMGN